MNFARDPIFGCELAQGRTDREGYVFWGKTRAHIEAWRRAHGELEPGMELDHLCRRRNCVALHHLEPVTRSENERRKRLSTRIRRLRCPKGHDLALARMMTPEGGVLCRACNAEAQRPRPPKSISPSSTER